MVFDTQHSSVFYLIFNNSFLKGGSFMARYCMDKNLIKVNTDKEGCTEVPFEKSTVCVCKNNLCNKATVRVHVPFPMLFIVVIVVFYF